mmetsp:Transcript_36335/g.97069  ORF Transcript_36335/g.97069 Transcript_36335/m.97069 type:complete len:251 (+) Transcript_36335:4143-4895(+)
MPSSIVRSITSANPAAPPCLVRLSTTAIASPNCTSSATTSDRKLGSSCAPSSRPMNCQVPSLPCTVEFLTYARSDCGTPACALGGLEPRPRPFCERLPRLGVEALEASCGNCPPPLREMGEEAPVFGRQLNMSPPCPCRAPWGDIVDGPGAGGFFRQTGAANTRSPACSRSLKVWCMPPKSKLSVATALRARPDVGIMPGVAARLAEPRVDDLDRCREAGVALPLRPPAGVDRPLGPGEIGMVAAPCAFL